MEIGGAIDMNRRHDVVERALQVDRKRLVRLLVEAELVRRPGLVPAGIIVIARGPMQAELHVVVRPDPLRGVDHATLERGEDVGARGQRRRAARLDVHPAAEARANAHPEALEVGDRVQLLAEPSGHLWSLRPARTWYEVEGAV